jgi:hypothetical protein
MINLCFIICWFFSFIIMERRNMMKAEQVEMDITNINEHTTRKWLILSFITGKQRRRQ